VNEKILGIQGWMTEPELNWIVETIHNLPDNAIIVELGAWRGRSTSAIFTSIKPTMTAITVDSWMGQPNLRLSSHKEVLQDDMFLEFMENMDRLGVKPTWYRKDKRAGRYYLRMESNIASLCFNNNAIDMIFIDCDHTKFGEDIDSWCRKVKQGAIIAGHDYQWEGAKEAIDDRINVVGTVESIWYGYKDGNINSE
jgi:predicted O-methyltransferase YrrM